MGMPGYTKLFSTILASTIWREDDKTRIVWITLLAMADKNGVAECSVPGLADMARVTVEDCRKSLAKLQEPDLDSRTKEHDGRRISPTDGGFAILNHAKYRKKLNQDERREYLKIKQAEFRKRKQTSTNVNNVSTESTLSTHTEAYTEAKSIKAKTTPSASPAKADSRFIPIRDFVQKCCEFAKVPFTWDGSEGNHLSKWLKANPTLSTDEVKALVRGRFRSSSPPGERPRKWIGDLGKYATERVSGNGQSKQDERTEKSRAAITRVLGPLVGRDRSVPQERSERLDNESVAGGLKPLLGDGDS